MRKYGYVPYISKCPIDLITSISNYFRGAWGVRLKGGQVKRGLIEGVSSLLVPRKVLECFSKFSFFGL